MTIKTLTYIHQLLIDDVARCRRANEIATDARNRAEDEEADNLQTLEEARKKTWEHLRKATNALEDFEAQEW